MYFCIFSGIPRSYFYSSKHENVLSEVIKGYLWIKAETQSLLTLVMSYIWPSQASGSESWGARVTFSFRYITFYKLSTCKGNFPVFPGQLFQHLHHIRPDVVKHFGCHRVSDTGLRRHGRKSVLTPRPTRTSWFLFETVLVTKDKTHSHY